MLNARMHGTAWMHTAVMDVPCGHGGPQFNLFIMPAECPEGEVFSECQKCEETRAPIPIQYVL